ncbi:putative DNA topoisomerase type II [Diachasmimorpha longicaudata entomopoxvirus]|uniref:DNA topoisomerase 2 n=1 Tax=Diachasmimorpha longicaudata entomopoxvirus TaxID=109981 RepID=A0A7R5WMA1_9POXV|nr:putative DNA topoisomerase type II [Diachasmimorpha longicaudata entomopoxvirus]AKS26449.1 putative DNA topoisomerase type II [Diachasmimorpha longicaudata entomopoxvirus]
MAKLEYTKKTQLEHVLSNPEFNLGSCTLNTDIGYQASILQPDNTFEIQTIVYPPGLLKLCDEIISNAHDHYLRQVGTKNIKITTERLENNDISITVWNDGTCIPIEIHPEYKMYTPSFIFGDFLSSSNYNHKNKTWIGTYGLGAKLTNAFSKKFVVKVYDKKNQKLFVQSWYNQMSKKDEPEITTANFPTDFVQVSFIPDLTFFEIRDDTLDSLEKMIKTRACELVFNTSHPSQTLQVSVNNQNILHKSFKEFVDLHNLGTLYSITSENYSIHMAIEENVHNLITYVNNSKVEKGTHVTAFKKILLEFIEKHSDVTPLIAKKCLDHMTIFISCIIKDPKFDGQTKQNLVSKLPDGYYDQVIRSKKDLAHMLKDSLLIDLVTKRKISQKIVKSQKVKGIYKLTDAPDAGKPKTSANCTLILTEGDSAKALAISGIGALDIDERRRFGVFPLKGKLLNVRVCTKSKVANNEEIKHLMTILGLKFQTKYTSVEGLRYGKVMIMTDQDVDGFHIKGLIINFFSFFWPELLSFNMIEQFITPIVKVTIKTKTYPFYDLASYNKWILEHPNEKKKVKYYKGLGTSTSQEAKEYFRDFARHRITFKEEESDQSEIVKAFSKLRTSDRKTWILNHIDTQPENSQHSDVISYSEFINKDLIVYSMSDIIRSIPLFIDGLKPSQRKILYTMKKKKFGEVKVSQMIGAIMENTAYHHGEASLSSTIVGMAQNFVCSNNINLLVPKGQFGTRLQGGNDCASSRYIYTQLNPITNYIFRPEDEILLNSLIEEEKEIEPEYYLPIIPMILVNGARGIGTGWSTYIPSYNPLDIIKNLQALINSDPLSQMLPYAENFKGLVKMRGEKFYTFGRIFKHKKDNTTLIINELPWDTWIEPYAKFLEELPGITFENISTEDQVLFRITAQQELIDKLQSEENGYFGYFQLYKQFSLKNTYYLYDNKPEKMVALDMLTKFYHIRLEFYKKRLDIERKIKLEKLKELENKKKFIVEDKLTAVDKKKADVEQLLEKKGYFKKNNSYDYLLHMPFISLTQEKVIALDKEIENIKEQLKNHKSPKEAWLSELSMLDEQLKSIKKSQITDPLNYTEIHFLTKAEDLYMESQN